ncbi:MAG: hypothetical protein ABSG84_14000 [Acidobacteriaceae bacterium]|jgi:hypothetical protein
MDQPTRIIDASKIEEIGEFLSGSADRQLVYKAIYSGGAKPKGAKDIAKLTGLSEMRILQIATPMSNHGYVASTRSGGKVKYLKYRDLVPKRDQILALARNEKRLKAIKNAKNGRVTVTVNVSKPAQAIRVDLITIDDIDSFAKVRKVPFAQANALRPKRLREKVFKYGLAKILGETGTFQDWGGEKNDLYSINLRIKSKRLKSAIALKGIATKPPLTIKKLGKNANQIPHLFESTAEVFFIQFEGQISEEVVEQMETYAIRKSKETGKLIRYGVIGADDSARLRIAYPTHFR